MRTTTAEYIERINQPIRETTQVSARIYSDSTGIGLNIYSALDFDYDIGSNNWGNGGRDNYIATFCENGMCIGDDNCIIADENLASNKTKFMPQSKVITKDAVILFDKDSFLISKSNVVTISFKDIVPTRIDFVASETSTGIVKTRSYTDIKNYDTYEYDKWGDSRISITMYGLPRNCRVKMPMMAHGYIMDFNNANITSVDHLLTTDLMSATLPTNKFVVSVYDKDGKYDPANPNSEYGNFQRDSRVVISYGYAGEMFEHSVNYLDDIPQYDNGILTLTSVSKLELQNVYETRGNTNINANKGATLETYDIKNRVIGNGSISTYWTDVPGIVNTNAVVGSMPFKQLVQLAGNAYCAYLVPDNTRVYAHSTFNAFRKTPIDFYLKASDMKGKYPKLTMNNTVSDVKYTNNKYKCSETGYSYVIPKVTTIANIGVDVQLPEQFQKMTRLEVVSSLPSSVTSVVGGKGSSRYPYVRVTANANITLTNVEVKIYLAETESNITTISLNESGDVMPIDNPFLSSVSDVSAHAFNVNDIYSNRQLFEVEYSQDFRLELGDVILIDTKYETGVKIIITELHYKLPGRFGVLKGRRVP